jgi:hypothetical protein
VVEVEVLRRCAYSLSLEEAGEDLLTMRPFVDPDYGIAGLPQPWIDGVITEPGFVRQMILCCNNKKFYAYLLT